MKLTNSHFVATRSAAYLAAVLFPFVTLLCAPARSEAAPIISPTGSIYTSVSATAAINPSYTPDHLFDQDPVVGAEISTSGSDAGFAYASTADTTPLYVEFEVDRIYTIQSVYFAQRDFNDAHNSTVDKIGTIDIWTSDTTPFSAADPGTPPDRTVVVTHQLDDTYLEYALSAPLNGRYVLLRLTATAGSAGGAYGGVEFRLGGDVPCVSPPPNMTGWWPGDGNLFEIQGGHNAAGQSGGPVFDAGKVGQAMSFDGVDDTAKVENFPDPNAAYSFDMWVYWKGTTNGSGHDALLVKTQNADLSGGDSYAMFIANADNNLLAIVGGDAFSLSTGPNSVPLNQWFHVAETFDGSELKMYINGEVAATGSATRSASAGVLAFGTRQGVQHFLHGLLDEIEVFSRALTADEVKAIYDAGSAGKCKPAISALWYNGDFDDSSALRNEETNQASSSIYDDFIVPAGQEWTLTSIFSNNLSNAAISGADWSVRSGLAPGDGGTIIASGSNSPVTLTPTGRNKFGLNEFSVAVPGQHLVLPSGTYWLKVTPVSPNPQSYISTTAGANAVGSPPGNNTNSFWDSSTYGQNFSPQGVDYSMGVDGSTCQTSTFYRDADGDSYGDPTATKTACSAPDGYVADNTDCDDNDAAIHPGATEICDGKDNNCDGQIDEGIATTTFYRDADEDGYGNPGTSLVSCSAPSGYVSDNTDCDDTDAAVHPGATEICDGKDNNCDGQIDEGVTSTFYRDADGDGYGDPNTTVQACSVPSGYVANGTDCDDSDPAVHPGATEICDGKDNNCDGQIDEGVTSTFYRDADGDGYGNPNVTVQACTAPSGYVSDNTDCNDSNAAVHPGATELCDGVDNNCNSQIDEGCDTTPPVITVPANIVVKANAKQNHKRGSFVSFTVSATDNVDGTVPATANPPSGSFFPLGITTVVVTAEDSHHNSSQKQFTVTVKKKL